MIRVVSILLVLLAGVVPVPRAYTEPSIDQILNELNLARTDPAGYAQFLKERRVHYKGKRYDMGGGTALMTFEGVSALDEAIAFLEKRTRHMCLHCCISNKGLLMPHCPCIKR